jgi:hypothetical protein
LVILAHVGDRLLMRQVLAPEWLRVRDAADYSGISQTELFRLCLGGEIQSVHKLKPGQAKGIRLVNKPSLDAYVQGFLPGGSRYVASPEVRRGKLVRSTAKKEQSNG